LIPKFINPYAKIETTQDVFNLQRGGKTLKCKIFESKYEKLAFKYFSHRLN